jgi:hypothetical protein
LRVNLQQRAAGGHAVTPSNCCATAKPDRATSKSGHFKSFNFLGFGRSRNAQAVASMTAQGCWRKKVLEGTYLARWTAASDCEKGRSRNDARTPLHLNDPELSSADEANDGQAGTMKPYLRRAAQF